MPKRFHSSEAYAGRDARKAQEAADSHMISGHGSFANMPQEVIFKPYGQTHSHLPEGLDDTGRGVEKQIGLDESGLHKHLHPKKV